MNIKTSILGFIGLFICSSAIAQKGSDTRHSLTLHYGISLPMGDSYISKSSFVAPSVSYLYRASALFETGISVGYINSGQISDEQFSFGQDIISGSSERTLTLIPIQGEFRYIPLGKKDYIFQPYVGVAVGAQYAQFRITGEGIQTSGSNSWAFVVTPQIGLRAHLTHSKRLFVDARVMWQYSQNRWAEAHTISQQGIGVQLGLGFKF